MLWYSKNNEKWDLFENTFTIYTNYNVTVLKFVIHEEINDSQGNIYFPTSGRIESDVILCLYVQLLLCDNNHVWFNGPKGIHFSL